jgi:hypothetical protein
VCGLRSSFGLVALEVLDPIDLGGEFEGDLFAALVVVATRSGIPYLASSGLLSSSPICSSRVPVGSLVAPLCEENFFCIAAESASASASGSGSGSGSGSLAFDPPPSCVFSFSVMSFSVVCWNISQSFSAAVPSRSTLTFEICLDGGGFLGELEEVVGKLDDEEVEGPVELLFGGGVASGAAGVPEVEE